MLDLNGFFFLMRKAKKLLASLLAGVITATAPIGVAFLTDSSALAQERKSEVRKKSGKKAKKPTSPPVVNPPKKGKDKKDKKDKKDYKQSPPKSYKSKGNRR